jgi:nucleoside-diphosphate-sugar epimerase
MTPANISSDMKKRVLITGAAGCVGCQLINELLEAGFHVVAVDRPGVPLPDPRPGILDVIEVDLTNGRMALEIAKGVDVVVNLAAIVNIALTFKTLAPVNLDAVRYLYQGAVEGGSSLFIHFSTGSLYQAADYAISEDHPLQALNDYARTKLLSEDFLLSRDCTTGPAVNIIRPALIFGPRGKVLISAVATTAALLRRYTKRMVRLCGGTRTNFVHSFDMARAVRFLIEHPQPHAEVFNVANDDARPVGEQLSIMLEIAGMDLTGWSVPLPMPLLRWLRPAIDHDIVFRLINQKLTSMWERIQRENGLATDGVTPQLDRESLDYITGDFVFDNSRLKKLGFEYIYGDLESGWRNTIEWYQDNRWIPYID